MNLSPEQKEFIALENFLIELLSSAPQKEVFDSLSQDQKDFVFTLCHSVMVMQRKGILQNNLQKIMDLMQ